jgi:hypothetical protein
MMMGLGAAASTTTTVAVPTFMQGLQMWTTPLATATDGGNALTKTIGTLISNPSQSFTGSLLPFTAGVLLPPVALIVLLMSMGQSSGGRH